MSKFLNIKLEKTLSYINKNLQSYFHRYGLQISYLSMKKKIIPARYFVNKWTQEFRKNLSQSESRNFNCTHNLPSWDERTTNELKNSAKTSHKVKVGTLIVHTIHLLGMKEQLTLTLYCIMLKNGQTYFKNLAVFTPQDFYSMFGHFSTLCNKGLMIFCLKLSSRIMVVRSELIEDSKF